MSGYLLDTDICVFWLRDGMGIADTIVLKGERNCLISEITIAELRFGAERSNRQEKEHRGVDWIENKLTVLPISETIRIYAAEKARLWNIGQKIDDFDLLIGATAVYHDLTLITNNVKHFERMRGVRIENWMK